MLVMRLLLILILAVALAPARALAQADAMARRGAGVRAGVWNVRDPGAELTTYSVGPHFEGYFQRGLDQHVAIESTAGVWRRTSTTIQPSTGNLVDTDTYVIPLFTSIKIFPFTTIESRLEPFVLAGVGFALGIDAVGDNAIGGGGSTIATGFGFKSGAGLELHLNDVFGLVLGARYQWISYGEALGGSEKYSGIGFEGGFTYRFAL